MSTSAITQPSSLGGAQGPDPILKFEEDIEARRVAGPAVPTVLGWTLYLFVMLDAVMNARGIGSISMLVSGGFMSDQGGLKPRVTGIALAVSVSQLVFLAVAGSFLAASPWRRWLRVALRETWPGMPVIRMLKAVAAGNPVIPVNRSDLLGMLRDSVLFGVGVVFLGPVVASAFATNGGIGFILLCTSVVLSYGLTKLVVAVVGKARRDSASAAGLITGCVVPLVASAYAGSTATALHATQGAVNEFVYYQLGVFAISIIAIWLVQLGSVGDDELIVLKLGGGPTGILRDLPDLTIGAFKPFQFQVRPNGEKVVLLSRPVKGASSYQIHSTLDRHDPTTAQWSLLNLSELERSTGQLGITRQGHSRYLEARIDFRLATAVPEQYLQRLRASEIHIPIEDLSNAQSQIFSGNDVVSQMRQQLDTAISDQLDQTLQESDIGASALTSLNGILAEMRREVSQLKQGFDVQVAAFQASALTGLRLDRADEIRAHLVAALRDVAPLMGRVREAYSQASRLDQGSAATRGRLQADLEARVRSAMQRLASSNSASWSARSVTIRLIDLIELTVRSVDVYLTQDAQALHQEITALHKEAEAHWSQASSQLGAIAKEHGDVVRREFDRFFDPRTPGHIRIWGLGQLAGSGSSSGDGLGGGQPSTRPQGPTPVFQRQGSGAGNQTGQATPPPGGNPNQSAASGVPVFNRSGSNRSGQQGPASSPKGPFPD